MSAGVIRHRHVLAAVYEDGPDPSSATGHHICTGRECTYFVYAFDLPPSSTLPPGQIRRLASWPSPRRSDGTPPSTVTMRTETVAIGPRHLHHLVPTVGQDGQNDGDHVCWHCPYYLAEADLPPAGVVLTQAEEDARMVGAGLLTAPTFTDTPSRPVPTLRTLTPGEVADAQGVVMPIRGQLEPGVLRGGLESHAREMDRLISEYNGLLGIASAAAIMRTLLRPIYDYAEGLSPERKREIWQTMQRYDAALDALLKARQL